MSRTPLIALSLLVFACKGDPTVVIMDADGDGFTVPLDCDDDNADINPGALDVFNDDVDMDCDGEDGAVQGSEAWSATFEPTTDDFPGYRIAACALQGDDADELLVAVPFRSGGGAVDVFPGPLDEGTIFTVDADTEITGTVNDSLGYGLRCGDVDGDGNMDVVSSSPSSRSDQVRIYVWYGTGVEWMPEISTDTAASFTATISDQLFANPDLAVADLDGDGASEILVCSALEAPNINGLYIIGGDAHTGTQLLTDAADHYATGQFGCWEPTVLDDLDGDGNPDVALRRGEEPNLVFFSNPTHVDGASIDDVSYGGIHPLGGRSSNVISGDFDGDGSVDDLVFTSGTIAQGDALVVAPDAFSYLPTTLNPAGPNVGRIEYQPDSAQVAALGDVDGEPGQEVLLAAYRGDELNAIVISPALRLTGVGGMNPTRLFHIRQPGSDFIEAHTGDFDGDGEPDVAISTTAIEGPNRVDVLFGSTF